MDLQMMNLRKKAGYQSRKAFADAFGEAERRVKSWERGETKLTLEDACRIADFLECSLDELAGREWPIGSSETLATDERALMETYRGLDRERQDRLLDVAQDMEAASDRGSPPEALEDAAG